MKPRTVSLDTRQLGLFDDSVDIAAEPPPLATSPTPPPIPEPVPAAPAVSIASVLAPAVFRHPQADRQILLQEHTVGYALKRVRRRTRLSA